MKYVLMFTSRPDLDADGRRSTQAVYGRVYDWFQENAAVFADTGAELLGSRPPRPSRRRRGVVVDGPFNEAKEVIGGFSVIDVPDMDAAIAIAKTWPQLGFPGVAIEIRPMVEDYSQFE